MVFLNSLAIAYFFGTQLKVDLYFYSYNTVLLIVSFITSLNASVIIPESMRIRAQEKPGDVIYFFNFFIYGYLALTILLCLIFFINPINAFITLSNYNPEVLRKQAEILYLSVPLIMLVTITNMLTDVLTSYRFFTIPMIAAMINSFFSLMFILIFHSTLDVRSITFGLLASYTTNIIFLLFLMRRFLHWNFMFKYVPLGRKVWENIAYAQAGNFVTTLGGYAPLYFLSGVGTGIIASLNYAQQISTQPTSFITNQVSAVSRIKISELYVTGDYERVNSIFQSTTKFLIFVLLPISGIFFLYADEIITILFKRGSFDSHSVKMSADFLRYLGLSLPCTAVISIAGNLYVAAQLIKVSIGYQILSNLLLIVFVYIALRWFGPIGYPLAFLGINILNVLVVQIFCRIFFPFIKYLNILKYLSFLIGLNAIIVFGLTLIRMLPGHRNAFFVILTGGGLYLATLLVVNFVFHLNTDFNGFLASIRQKVLKTKT